MNRIASIACTILALATASFAADKKADAIKEYCRRLAETPPRSAPLQVELAEWCRSAGLEAEAIECYRRALAIDMDCEPARTALGYKRYGTGWRKPGEAPQAMTQDLRRGASTSASAAAAALPGPSTVPGPAASAPTAPPAASPEASAGAPGAGDEVKAPPDPAGSGGTAVSEGTTPETTATKKEPPPTGPKETPKETVAEAGAFAADVEKKKAWAKSAADKLATTFQLYEDNDFLIHSTLPASSREVKTLVAYLKALKKIVAAIIGAGPSTRIWPDKLHLVLLKSEPEYERFADIVDGVKSAKNPEGAYTEEDHTTLWMPESALLPRLLGETALKKLNGSNRWVGWWLEEGLGEAIFAQSPVGQKANHYSESITHAADLIQAEGENLKIFNIIETRDFKRKDEARSRALALSLVDFLMKVSKKGFQDLVKALKSEKAPAPPASDGESSAYLLSYISFQEETMKSSFRLALPALNDKWKAYVLSQAAKLRAAQDEKDEPKQQKKKGKKKGE
jgi:hypothetical protein